MGLLLELLAIGGFEGQAESLARAWYQLGAGGKLGQQAARDLAAQGTVDEGQPKLYEAGKGVFHPLNVRDDSGAGPVCKPSLRLGLDQRWAFCPDLAWPYIAKNRVLAIDFGS